MASKRAKFYQVALVKLIVGKLKRGTSRLARDMKRAMAEELIKLILKGYEAKARGARGMDGIKWEPTQDFQKYGWPMLIKTRRMIESFDYIVTDTGFQIINKAPYAKYQFPKRPVAPQKPQEFPREWLERLARIAAPFLKAIAEESKQELRFGGLSKQYFIGGR